MGREEDTENDVDFDFSDNSEEDFEFHSAARKGDVSKLMALLEGGSWDVNAKGNVRCLLFCVRLIFEIVFVSQWLT